MSIAATTVSGKKARARSEVMRSGTPETAHDPMASQHIAPESSQGALSPWVCGGAGCSAAPPWSCEVAGAAGTACSCTQTTSPPVSERLSRRIPTASLLKRFVKCGRINRFVSSRHLPALVSTRPARLGAAAHGVVALTHALAALRARVTDRRACATGLGVEVRAAHHEGSGRGANLRAVGKRRDVIARGVLSAYLETMVVRFEASLLAFPARANTAFHRSALGCMWHHLSKARGRPIIGHKACPVQSGFTC